MSKRSDRFWAWGYEHQVLFYALMYIVLSIVLISLCLLIGTGTAMLLNWIFL